ncbi:hypothetical protein DCS_04516 [Drechmeria coniospora]|uniref:Arsenical-resistance protein n=1 Tax=Drechmeria coniospora TaxID=98403 RepID=A0A151GK87_DRECN|nr:hypothetical protein DCS_04516 [Drechmeria coniospora]KYK57506.1 hypothetical protein DCS_04516 [Drechmeria coniospora]
MSAEPKSRDFTGSPLAQQPDVASATTQDLEGKVDRDGNGKKDTVSAFKALGWLDRFLALWIFLAMAIGIILGKFVPSAGPALQKGKFVGVSVPIVMMYPILCKVRYESLHELLARRSMWKQILFSVVVNWVVAPFLMVIRPAPLSSQPSTH